MDKLRHALEALALETFETMCFLFPVDETEYFGDVMVALDNLPHAMVEFTGHLNGAVLLTTTPELMDAIVNNMLDIVEVEEEHRTTALSELTNIVCGNVIPLLTAGRGVCHMQPPRMASAAEISGQAYVGKHHESIRLTLDEGLAEIQIYYS